MANVLILGSGAREHALGTVLRDHSVAFLPGNAGTRALGENVAGDPANAAHVVRVARERKIELVVVGPEAPLCAGVVDALSEAGILAFGPSRAGAALEGSKVFMKDVLARAGVPTAAHRVFSDAAEASAYVREANRPLVVKADGLCAGKGVVVATSTSEALDAVQRMLEAREFGDAGARIVIEELLPGEEASFHAITDGERYVCLAPAQDHKRIFEGDRGPNTGGMGAYAPAPVVTAAIHAQVCREIIEPTLAELRKRGTPFRGVLFAGLMIHEGRASTLEFNVRFGDPETGVILPLLEGDVYALLASCARGSLDESAVRIREGAALGVVLAAEGYPGKVTSGDVIAGLDAFDPENADARPHAQVLHAGTRAEGEKVLTAGGRVLLVVGQGESLQNARDAAYRRVASIAWRGQQLRRDIGHRVLGSREE